MEYFAQYHFKDRQRVTRLALDPRFWDVPKTVFLFVQLFENLEELVIKVAEDFPSYQDEWFFVDCTAAEALAPRNQWRPWSIYPRQIREYFKAHPNGLPFYGHLVMSLERYVTQQLESLTQQGKPGFKIPRFRYVNVTDAQGKKDLEAVRARY